jgi:predicted phosphodiesterase
MACTGDYDLVCFGHEHKPELMQVGNIKGGQTWLVNPGTVGGVGHAPTYVMGDLQAMQFETLPVPVPETVPSAQPRVTPHV